MDVFCVRNRALKITLVRTRSKRDDLYIVRLPTVYLVIDKYGYTVETFRKCIWVTYGTKVSRDMLSGPSCHRVDPNPHLPPGLPVEYGQVIAISLYH